jgi:hypothetical protein
MNASVWLGLAVLFAALWSGLLLTITTILHPIYAARDGSGFAGDLHRFLPVARRSPTNYVLVLGLIIAPAVALIALWGENGEAPFSLTAIGLAFVLAGPLLSSRLLAEPNYEVIMGWDPDALPADWTLVRSRYFALNWLRGVLTWTALGFFVAATWIQVS